MDKFTELNKTWILDLDGTLLKHNGYLNEGDLILPGVIDFISNINSEDVIIITTSRKKKYIKQTKKFLKMNGIRYNYLISDLPVGERIIFNDKKNDQTKMCYAFNLNRDSGLLNYLKIVERDIL